MKSWVEKYRPETFDEISGQSLAVEKVQTFLKNFGRGKKALVLYGGPGVGKTTIALAAAKSLKYECFELNASDLRNKEKLHDILKPATEQKSLLKDKKLILVDEVDGISGSDRGGITELLSIIQTTQHPLILTANDIWDQKLSTLRTKSELVQVKDIDYSVIKAIIQDILTKEKRTLPDEVITKIAIKAKGDVRAALNDAETVSQLDDPSSVFFDERNKEVDIFNALRQIFKTKPTEETLRVLDEVNMPIEEVILWVEENIPLEYNDLALVRAYDALSRVDVFKGRIHRQQYWRFLVYENAFLTYGVSAAKKNVKTGFTSYKKPGRILKIWLNNQRTAKKKSIAEKLAQKTHIGTKRAMNDFKIFVDILKNHDVRKELRLTEEETDYLHKIEETA